ncbi:glypican-1-like [Bolinopsis microptera]|uniref:glypican-1-like n=1 Tax=Bolinopsis microptera TaxID=2820187 RepID=UPI003079B989
MVREMKVLCLLSLLVGVAQCFEDYEHVEDSCNAIARYMSRKSGTYDQMFSKEPEEPLEYCGSGTTCCTREIEENFYNDTAIIVPRISFMKDPYVRRLTNGRDHLVDYMTQVLTMASRYNQRTGKLVATFMEMSKYKIQTIDVMQYPVFTLLDIAQSHGVNKLLNSTNCIAEMRDFLHPLAAMQIDALKIARLLYKSIPVGIEVLTEMKNQAVSQSCIEQLVKSQKCSECRDSTDVKPCRSYCMAITSQCFSHLTAVAEDWEKFASLTDGAMDKLDNFAKVYEEALSTSIQKIVEKLRDPLTADMCGYDVSKNLAAKHKRAADASESKARKALFDGSFMLGMLEKLDSMHCQRYSTEEIKCWNGSDVGLFTGSSSDIQVTNDATVTPKLVAALLKVTKFNEFLKTIENIEFKGVEYNLVAPTDAPVFVYNKDKKSAALQTAILSIGLFLVSLLLH